MEEKKLAICAKQITKVYKLYEKPSDRLKEALGLSRNKLHKEHYALKGVDLDIYKGETVGIIGTNGSGKSNISDALLWVMGEQSSKTLRGAKMEDVIFGGTQKRSAVGFAEATLTLDNTDRALPYDADEVMITRRYYRSGDSEYYINIKQLLCSIIDENTEVAERIENYFFMFSKFRFRDENTSVIEENYKKITGSES